MKLNKFLAGILFCVVIASCSKTERVVTVAGKIHFVTEQDSLFVVIGQQDSVIHSIWLNPDAAIRDFSFTLANPVDVVYSLRLPIHGGRYVDIKFKPDHSGDEVFLDLYSSYESAKNQVSGSKTTAEMWRKDHVRDSLYGHDFARLYSVGGTSRDDDLYAEMIEWQLKDIEENISIANYHDLVDIIKTLQDDPPVTLKRITPVWDIYRKKYPKHTYTSLVVEIEEARHEENAKWIDGTNKLFAGVKTKLTLEEKIRIFKLTGWKNHPDEGHFQLGDDELSKDYPFRAEVYPVDFNNDGEEEVFISYGNSFTSGRAGSSIMLLIPTVRGYKRNFNFEGLVPGALRPYTSPDYPELLMGGPGFSFPIWKWDGQEYRYRRRISDTQLGDIETENIMAISQAYQKTI